jgi:hypothetical protein
MKRKNWLLSLGLAATLLPAAPALAADHLDGAAVKEDHSTDINDVYSWMSSDGMSVYLAMTVYPAAPKTGAKFSNAAYYVFHTASRPAAGGAETKLDIICGFSTAQMISCWVGDNTNFVYGDASQSPGVTNAMGVQVYAATVKDHFFFNLAGFNQARADVKANLAAVSGANANAQGCPSGAVGSATQKALTAVATDLQKDTGGVNNPVDFFLPLDTLAIVMKVPVATLTKGGPLLAVYGATHRKG